jgi:hypothetical protein
MLVWVCNFANLDQTKVIVIRSALTRETLRSTYQFSSSNEPLHSSFPSDCLLRVHPPLLTSSLTLKNKKLFYFYGHINFKTDWRTVGKLKGSWQRLVPYPDLKKYYLSRHAGNLPTVLWMIEGTLASAAGVPW